MNEQATNLIEKVFCHKKRDLFHRIDTAIALLYVYGFLPRSRMIVAREKLIKQIQKELTHDK